MEPFYKKTGHLLDIFGAELHKDSFSEDLGGLVFDLLSILLGSVVLDIPCLSIPT